DAMVGASVGRHRVRPRLRHRPYPHRDARGADGLRRFPDVAARAPDAAASGRPRCDPGALAGGGGGIAVPMSGGVIANAPRGVDPTYRRQGVSDTGVNGPLPENHEMRLSARSSAMIVRVLTEAEPTCGSSTTLSMAIRAAGTLGSSAKTSRPAARM